MNEKNDRILPITRWVSIIVIPFLWVAFVILYFFPDTTGRFFAWGIKPHMTAMYLGAGYLGGSWLFINAVIQKRWHRIQGGFLPITVFTWFMLIATIVYWDRFAHGNISFWIWLILYVVSPFLVPVLWWLNRKTDPKTPEVNDVIIAKPVLWGLKIVAAGTLIFVLVGLVNPNFIIQVWPWQLSPLTALIMCGWIMLLVVGAFVMSFEPRWSAWKVPLVSILIWHILVLIAALMNVADFPNGLANWYIISVALMVIGISALYVVMEMRRRKER